MKFFVSERNGKTDSEFDLTASNNEWQPSQRCLSNQAKDNIWLEITQWPGYNDIRSNPGLSSPWNLLVSLPTLSIRTENSMNRWSCLLVNMQRAGSSRLPATAEQKKLLIPGLPETAFTTKQAKWRKTFDSSSTPYSSVLFFFIFDALLGSRVA